MKSILMTTATALTLGATMSHADAFTDSIIRDLQSKGFERIEIENRPNRVKVEATRGARKTEVLYDRSTGRILSQDWGDAYDDYEDPDTETQTRPRFTLVDLFGGTNRTPDRDDDDDDDDDDDRHDWGDDDDDYDDRDDDDRDDRDSGGRDDDRDDGGRDDDGDDNDDSDDDGDDDDDDD